MEKHNSEIYQVYSVDADNKLVITEHKSFDEAEKVYHERNGFLLIGIDAPQCFDVIYAHPIGIDLIS